MTEGRKAMSKENWKEIGEELGTVLEKLGKTVVKTAFDAVKKVDAWAHNESQNKVDDSEQ